MGPVPSALVEFEGEQVKACPLSDLRVGGQPWNLTGLDMLDFEYKTTALCIIICLVFSTVIFGASFSLGRESDLEMVSIYECGFDPSGGPRIPFEVKKFFWGC